MGRASALVSDFGVDEICQHVSDGVSMTAIAAKIGVSKGTLLTWVSADPDRSARVRVAREGAARLWDEKAEEDIRAASDPFELAKARELAFHYRWRAAKIAPREYGDKVQHTGGDGGPIGFVLCGQPEAKDANEWASKHAPQTDE